MLRLLRSRYFWRGYGEGTAAFVVWVAVAAVFVILLSACASVPTVKTVCPPIRAYSPAEQSSLANELRALDQGSAVVRAIIDYGQLRAEIRACQASSGG